MNRIKSPGNLNFYYKAIYDCKKDGGNVSIDTLLYGADLSADLSAEMSYSYSSWCLGLSRHDQKGTLGTGTATVPSATRRLPTTNPGADFDCNQNSATGAHF